MPKPVFDPYMPQPNESLEQRVKNLTNAYVDLVQQLQFLMNGKLDEKNVLRSQESIVYAGTIEANKIVVTNGKIQDDQIDTAEEWNAAIDSYNNFVDTVYPDDMAAVQAQLDGVQATYFYEGTPTLSNLPAVEWTTDEMKLAHLDDMYFNTATSGKAYRFKYSSGTYSWDPITDPGITAALAAAADAKYTADHKHRNFTAQPIPPYDVGDSWSQGSAGDLKVCTTARASGSYVAGDWVKATKYTDDTLASTNNINLVKNGGAEICTGKAGTYIPDGWSITADANLIFTNSKQSYPSLTIDGESSFQIVQTNGDTGLYGFYFQGIPNIKPGTQYTLSGKIRTFRSYGFLRINFFNSSDTIIGTADSPSILNPVPQSVSITATAPTGTVRANVYVIKLGTESGEPNSYFFADNIKLEEGAVQTAYVETELGSSEVLNNALRKDVQYNHCSITPEDGFKAEHPDGYTKMEYDGFTRYIAGTGHVYKYLTHVGSSSTTGGGVNIPTDIVTVTLPADFRNKNFTVTAFFQNWSTGGWSGADIKGIKCKIMTIDYVNATFTVDGYVYFVDGFDYGATPLDFAYIAQY